MPFFPGTGPQALRDLFIDEYQPQRAGRPDLPPLIEDPATDFGVRVLADREAVNHQRATTDLIHCLHPENNPMDRVDQGFKEERVTEYVQVDISVSDRTDPDTGERLSARERLVGTREQQLETYGFTLGGTDGTTYGGDDGGTLGTDDEIAYPGIFGEVWYVLERVRRGYKEWDTVSADPIQAMLKNSQAKISLDVELEQISRNTVV